MRLAQTLRYVFVGLVFAAMPLSAQNPIKFHTANNTVFTDSLQSLYVDLCLGAFHDTSGVHRSGKMYLDVTLNDGGLATTCSGGTGTNLVSDLSLKPGVNYFVVEVTDWNWTVYRDSILVTYQLPAGTGGAPYVIAPAEGGLRLMPGEERTMTFVVTNVSQDTTDFDVTLSCTGGSVPATRSEAAHSSRPRAYCPGHQSQCRFVRLPRPRRGRARSASSRKEGWSTRERRPSASRATHCLR